MIRPETLWKADWPRESVTFVNIRAPFDHLSLLSYATNTSDSTVCLATTSIAYEDRPSHDLFHSGQLVFTDPIYLSNG